MKKSLMILSVLTLSMFAQEPQAGVENLSVEVRGLLAEEMRHIEKGMQEMMSHMVKGEYEQIAKTATEIQNSFIFKKNLTDAQRAELKAKIPKEFIALDQSFHETAGMLAQAAEFDDRKEVEASYAMMLGKCVACHSTYATHRFGSFTETE